jgi:Zn-dependent M28 family amino/carboxypeptidase
MKKAFLAALSAATVLGTLVSGPVASAVPASTDTSDLRDAVTVAGIMEHQQEFQAIASANGNTRVSGTPGYDQSADYVAERLEAAGYDVTRDEFEFIYFEELATPVLERTSAPTRNYVHNTEFITMDYSGSGDVTEELVATNDIVIPPGSAANSSDSGCEAGDFPATTSGNISLIQRGTCTFFEKAFNAQQAGAVGVIIFNEGQDGRQETLAGTLGAQEDITIPVTGISFADGQELFNLLQSGPVTMHMFTSVQRDLRETENVLANTPTGRADRVVLVGAHLDSVSAGPGINDNGSGSSTILEIAEEMAELEIDPVNQVRFAFWGAEESGLVGSELYAATLPQRELRRIALNLNFDMVGSPNYVRFVYDGDGDPTGIKGPSGSDDIEDTFNEYFASQGLETDPTAFDGRSDYGPFIARGIPAGGLFSGAEGIKTEEQEEIYGGTAGVAYDPCYHQACDTIANLSMDALDELSDGAAHATLVYAMTQKDVNGKLGGAGGQSVDMEFQGSKRIK